MCSEVGVGGRLREVGVGGTVKCVRRWGLEEGCREVVWKWGSERIVAVQKIEVKFS